MSGRNTSSGNHAGQRPHHTPAMPKTPARNPSGTDPTSPMNVRAGGALTRRNGRMAPQSAKKSPGGPPASAVAAPQAANPHMAAVAASPSLPSMKLNRFADQTIVSASAPTRIAVLGAEVRAGRHDGNRHGEGGRNVNDEPGRRRDASPIVDERHQRDRRECDHPCRSARHHGRRKERGGDEARPDREPAHARGRPIVQRPRVGGRMREIGRDAQKHADGEGRDDRRQNRCGDRRKGDQGGHRRGKAGLEPVRAGEGITGMEAPPGPQKPFKTGPQWRGRQLFPRFLSFPQPIMTLAMLFQAKFRGARHPRRDA